MAARPEPTLSRETMSQSIMFPLYRWKWPSVKCPVFEYHCAIRNFPTQYSEIRFEKLFFATFIETTLFTDENGHYNISRFGKLFFAIFTERFFSPKQVRREINYHYTRDEASIEQRSIEICVLIKDPFKSILVNRASGPFVRTSPGCSFWRRQGTLCYIGVVSSFSGGGTFVFLNSQPIAQRTIAKIQLYGRFTGGLFYNALPSGRFGLLEDLRISTLNYPHSSPIRLATLFSRVFSVETKFQRLVSTTFPSTNDVSRGW